jgi:hypothetical protein
VQIKRGVTCPGHRREERGKTRKSGKERGKCSLFLGFAQRKVEEKDWQR